MEPKSQRTLGRYGYRVAQIALDALVLSMAFAVGWLLRFDWQPTLEAIKRLLFQLPYVTLFELTLLYAFGAHRLVWRFISMRDAVRLGYAIGTSALVLFVARAISVKVGWGYATYALVPLTVIAINAVLAYTGIVGVRVLRRLLYERSERLGRHPSGVPAHRVLLLGAGRAGQAAARESAGRPDLGMHLVGFLDDDPTKIGTRIQGVDVLGPTSALGKVVSARDVDQVVLAMTQVEGEVVRRIAGECKALGVPAKMVPALHEILGGQVSVSRLRDVDIEDLLGRDPVELDTHAICDFMQHKVAVVTGAGGSIGSEICRQVASFEPRCLVLVERFETALFDIHNELVRRFPGLAIAPRLADVTDRRRMQAVLAEHGADVVFHAAAHKHVPMMEWNPGEAIKNNVLGTKIVADLAAECGVGHFVLISTDKAVSPASVMGAAKRVAELYVQAMAQRAPRTVFVSVRFGNVLGSSGSVIPIFKRQIAEGGPITVTHPEMRRYFMTIPEATQLVLQAATLGKGGEVFILDMGKPVKIVDLARDLIALSGLKPNDIEIEFIGTRPGEKLFEVLSTEEEKAATTRHPKIFVGRIPPADPAVVSKGVAELLDAAEASDNERVREVLRRVVADYKPTDEARAAGEGAAKKGALTGA